MRGRVSAALMQGAAVFGLVLCCPAQAETVLEATTLDPESPMAALPDLGIAWPEMGTKTALTKPVETVTSTTDQNAERRYRVVLNGINQVAADQLLPRFDALSALKAGENRNANVAQIDRRARDDEKLLTELLRTSGYFDARVSSVVEPPKGDERLRVVFAITPGARYRFSEVNVDGLTTIPDQKIREAFDLKAGDAVNADDIAGAQERLKLAVERGGYPFAQIGATDISIDRNTRTAALGLSVAPGSPQKIGKVIVTGEKPPFGAGHATKLGRFAPQSSYDQAKVDDMTRAIVATGLVSSARVEPVPGEKPGEVDLKVSMEPAPARTIAVEAGYGTGQGLQGEISWTHRNLIQPEGAVTVRAAAGTGEQTGGILLRMNNFKKRDTVFGTRLLATNTQRSAYDARTLEFGVNLERLTNLIWQKQWIWSVGGELLLTNERDVSAATIARQSFLIGSIPLSLAYDGSDNLLDPQNGFRVAVRLSPEFSFRSSTSAYLRAQIDGSGYWPVSDTVVMAGRVRVGTISGASTLAIAPSRRFYAGGGSSVRGFGFQNIGPRDSFNDPVGGRSLSEFGLEARIRLGSFSVVPFVDGGNIFAGGTPRFSNFRFGTGLGVRYHSNFGPIRIDIGTPINPQKGDSPVAVYVSLGQAF